MNLQELIDTLSKYPKKQKVTLGFDNPHSYRGYYDQLAFEPKENTTVGDMLKCAKKSLNKTFMGYKGGDYKMCEWTDVWLSEYGHTGESIGVYLLDYMLGSYNLKDNS